MLPPPIIPLLVPLSERKTTLGKPPASQHHDAGGQQRQEPDPSTSCSMVVPPPPPGAPAYSPSQRAAYARHMAHNDPEREAMLTGGHLASSIQFGRSGGLSVSDLLNPSPSPSPSPSPAAATAAAACSGGNDTGDDADADTTADGSRYYYGGDDGGGVDDDDGSGSYYCLGDSSSSTSSSALNLRRLASPSSQVDSDADSAISDLDGIGYGRLVVPPSAVLLFFPQRQGRRDYGFVAPLSQTCADTLSQSMSTTSMSARSTVYEFVEEHGRTFHRYKAGSESPNQARHTHPTHPTLSFQPNPLDPPIILRSPNNYCNHAPNLTERQNLASVCCLQSTGCPTIKSVNKSKEISPPHPTPFDAFS